MTEEKRITIRAGSIGLFHFLVTLFAAIVVVFAAGEGGAGVASAQGVEGPPAGVLEEGPFGDFDDEEEYPTPEELKAVLGQVPGQRYEITKRNRGRRPAAYIHGLFRLNLPWEAGKALRVSVWDPDGFRLHLWNGRTGVTLRYHRHFYQTWSAYGTTRDGGQPQPSARALWATDGGRYRRVGFGTVEVHYDEGTLTLARGDLRLMSVPMDGPPREVFVEGRGMVRGLAMARSALPDEPVRSRPAALALPKPAELEWGGELPEGVSLGKLPDGGVELRAEARAKEGRTGTALFGAGFCEIIFEVEDPEPGAGVYFADGEGNPLMRLGFFRDRTTRQTTFGLLHPSHREIDRSHDVARHVVPYAGKRQWLRVVLAAGVMKYWTSGDGVHWSRTAPAVQGLEGDCRGIGLYALEHDQPRAIKLRTVGVRRLDALGSLTPDTIQQQADLLVENERERFVKAGNLEVWEERVAELRTPHVDDGWWEACALATLAAGPNLNLARPLLDELVRRSLADCREMEAGLEILEEEALVSYSADRNVAERLASHYERFGRRMAREGEPRPLTTISRAMMRAPLWTDARVVAFSDHLLRHELFTLVGEDRWAEVADLSHRLIHWNRRQADPGPLDRHGAHLAFWAAAQAKGHVSADGRDPAGGVPLAWRHPLTERLSKEGYNVLAELDAALEAGAFRDACQVITTSAGVESLGLLPAAGDPRLWTPFSAAVEATMRDYPALRETMQREFGPVGGLRVKQAIAAGDAAGVETAAMEFYGTDAARDAAAWLGDRCLSHGRFAEALAHYQGALRGAAEERQDAFTARLRLAGAMLGRDVGAAPAVPVDLGAGRLSGAQFDKLLEELRQAHRPDEALGAAAPATQTGFVPGGYTAHAWARVDGERVERPSALPDRGFDWAGRQTAVAVADRRMLVNNQLDQLAFDLATGDLVWAQCRAVEGRFQQWPSVRMRPVLARGRVFVRQLADEGPELVALDGTTGRMMWSSKPDGHVASDPLLLGGHLVALTVGYHPGEKLALALTRFDPDSGEVLRRSPLAEFRDRWRRQLPVQATVAGGRIVVTAGGCVVCCDVSGRVLWLRRQICVPRAGDSHYQDPNWFEQVHEPPLVRDGRVYATQPGVWAVECLDLETGRLAWRQAVGGLTRPVGLAAGRLILQVSDGLTGLEARSGEHVWHFASDGRPEARLCGEPGLILVYHLEEEAKPPETATFALVWIDAETGEPRDRSVLKPPEPSGPWLGPLVARGDRQWALVADGEDAKSRRVMELRADPKRGAGTAR